MNKQKENTIIEKDYFNGLNKIKETIKTNQAKAIHFNLCYMSQFSKEFSKSEILQQAVGKIPWGTLVTVIMPKSSSHEEM